MKRFEDSEQRLYDLGLTEGPTIDDGLTAKGKRVAQPVLSEILNDSGFVDRVQRDNGNEQARMLFQYVGEMKPRPRSYGLDALEWTLLLLIPFLEALRIMHRIDLGEAIGTRRMA